MKKKAYSPPISEMSGYTTVVTEDSQKGLPGNTSLPSTTDSGGTQNPDHRERALPMPPKRRNWELPKFEFNTPYRPEGKPVPVRTLSVPGDEYGHPFLDQGTGIKQRRPGITASEEGACASEGRISPSRPLMQGAVFDRIVKKVAGDVMMYDREAPEDRAWFDEAYLPAGGTTWVLPTHTEPNILNKPDHQIPTYDLPPIREFPDNPGSARVIPSNHGFVNNTASIEKVAIKMEDLVRGTDHDVQDKGRGLSVRLSRVDTQNLTWRFSVSGSKGPYTVMLQAVPKAEGIKNLRNADVRVSCSCPFWRWRGPEHWSVKGDWLYGTPVGTATRPHVRDPMGRNLLCKHAIAALRFAQGYRLPGKDRKKLGAALLNMRIAMNVVRRYNSED